MTAGPRLPATVGSTPKSSVVDEVAPIRPPEPSGPSARTNSASGPDRRPITSAASSTSSGTSSSRSTWRSAVDPAVLGHAPRRRSA